MNRVLTILIIRLVLAVLLFQSIAPLFLANDSKETSSLPSDRKTELVEHHDFLSIPLLFKEKEETETEDKQEESQEPAILHDFTHQSFILTQTHGNKFNSVFHDHFASVEPGRCILNCTFRI